MCLLLRFAYSPPGSQEECKRNATIDHERWQGSLCIGCKSFGWLLLRVCDDMSFYLNQTWPRKKTKKYFCCLWWNQTLCLFIPVGIAHLCAEALLKSWQVHTSGHNCGCFLSTPSKLQKNYCWSPWTDFSVLISPKARWQNDTSISSRCMLW